MAVVATAGHVDHGKSALVRALTGIEPDRWAEERSRGLTIDLGYAWTRLDSGESVAFVDVPGHQRFIGNMLAGIGPSAAVMFVVAADEGWRRQSTEHLLAVDALGIEHVLLVVTRSDLADPAPALADAKARIARTSLGEVGAVAVSAKTGEGLPQLRAALGRLTAALPAPRRDGRVRLWVDRAFTIRGAGTVLTGTLGAGTLTTGEHAQLLSADDRDPRDVRIRGLQSLDEPQVAVSATARAAVNVPSVGASEVRRGDVLLTGDWMLTDVVDARIHGAASADLPEHVMLHVGCYAGQVRIRPLGAAVVRLQLPARLPLVVGDRAILRNPGAQHIVAGVEILDIAPPALRRRGAAAHRASRLTAQAEDAAALLADEVLRRGAVLQDVLTRSGHVVPDQLAGVRRVGDWLVAEGQWHRWVAQIARIVSDQQRRDPLEPDVTEDAVVAALALPCRDWLSPLAMQAGAEVTAGRVRLIGARPELGAAESGLAAIERLLAERPWAAPEQHDLDTAGLGPRHLAAAVRLGRIIRLPGDVVLLPSAPVHAMRVLAALPQPFTTSEARQALGTTRRVAVPLLEHLDSRGWTRRVDGSRREVVRGSSTESTAPRISATGTSDPSAATEVAKHHGTG